MAILGIIASGMQIAGGGGPTPELGEAVVFDGANDWLEADASAESDGKVGIFSVWIHPQALGNPSDLYILSGQNDASNRRLYFRTTSGGDFVLTLENSAGTTILNHVAGPLVYADRWNHIMASWDLANGISDIYVNGVQDTNAPATLTNDTIEYSVNELVVGDLKGASRFLDADISELYFNNAEFIDLTIQSNREKFILNDQPRDLGVDGSTPTGSQPAIYMTGTASTWNAGTNYGSITGFATTGSVLDSGNEPVQLPTLTFGPLRPVLDNGSEWYDYTGASDGATLLISVISDNRVGPEGACCLDDQYALAGFWSLTATVRLSLLKRSGVTLTAPQTLTFTAGTIPYLTKLDTDKAVIAFEKTTGGTEARVITRSGDTISSGAAYSVSTYNSVRNISPVIAMDTSNVLIAYHDTGDNLVAEILSVSGTTITGNTPSAAIETAPTSCILRRLDDTHALAVYGASGKISARILTISGTNVSLGTEQLVSTTTVTLSDVVYSNIAGGVHQLYVSTQATPSYMIPLSVDVDTDSITAGTATQWLGDTDPRFSGGAIGFSDEYIMGDYCERGAPNRRLIGAWDYNGQTYTSQASAVEVARSGANTSTAGGSSMDYFADDYILALAAPGRDFVDAVCLFNDQSGAVTPPAGPPTLGASSALVGAAGVGSVDIPVPTHSEGDMLIYFVSDFGNTSIGDSGGWNSIAAWGTNFYAIRAAAGYRIAGASEPATYNFTGATNPSGFIVVVENATGVTSVTPLEGASSLQTLAPGISKGGGTSIVLNFVTRFSSDSIGSNPTDIVTLNSLAGGLGTGSYRQSLLTHDQRSATEVLATWIGSFDPAQPSWCGLSISVNE